VACGGTFDRPDKTVLWFLSTLDADARRAFLESRR
jgi:hypothetical protein